MKRFFMTKLAWALALGMLLAGCQKELSFEAGTSAPEGTAEGVLGGAPGNCANAVVSGLYGVNLPVTDTNTLTIDITFTKAGTYTITTDTCNGLYFRGAGIVTLLTGAAQQVVLKAFGTPSVAGACNFSIKFKGSTCVAQCTVLPVAPATTADYFPTTVGSNWSYRSTDPTAGPADTVYRFANNANATIGSNLYRLLTLEDAVNKDSGFYRKVANDYYEFGDIDVAGVASNVVAVDHIFLKDDVPVGTSWESAEGDADIGGAAAKMKLRFRILAKGEDVAFGGQIYRNVIKVAVTSLAAPNGGAFLSIITYELWYAKGIGLMHVATPAPLFGLALTRYVVN
jgi:hypothetical protein